MKFRLYRFLEAVLYRIEEKASEWRRAVSLCSACGQNRYTGPYPCPALEKEK